MSQLYAGRFENDDTNAALIEQFRNPANIGTRWSAERHGIERIEVTIAGYNQYDAYERYQKHHGQRLAVYSPRLSRPISGNITGVEWLGGNRIVYVAKGPPNRLIDIPDTTEYTATQTVTQAITNILTNYVLIDDGTTDNIVTNSTQLQGWQPNAPEGGYPLDEFAELLAKSDSSNRIYDLIFVDQPLLATSLRKFTPYYTYREDDADPDWIISLNDLRGGRPQMTRTIDDFITTARVWYGMITGTATGGSDTTLVDTGKNFIIGGVRPGDIVTNITNGGSARVVSVAINTLTIDGAPFLRGKATTAGSTTTLVDEDTNFVAAGVAVNDVLYNDTDDSRGVITGVATTTNPNDTLQIAGAMSGSKQNDAGERYRIVRGFSSADAYSIKTKAQTKYKEASTDTAPYWERTKSLFEPAMDGVQAQQYANYQVDTEPQQQQDIVIGAKYIKDRNGAEWPLAEVIARGGGYIQINDLYPAAALASTSRDRLTTFKITSASFDNASYALTLSLDTSDNSLAARLLRANILGSGMIYR